MDQTDTEERRVVGGVDTLKDLHIAVVVDRHGWRLAAGEQQLSEDAERLSSDA